MTNTWSLPQKESFCLSQFESNSNLAIPHKVAQELSSTLLNDKKIGIACSGGADSVFLTLLLFFQYSDLRKNLHLLHFNHLLRGKESELDEKFVKDSLPNFIPIFKLWYSLIKRMRLVFVHKNESLKIKKFTQANLSEKLSELK